MVAVGHQHRAGDERRGPSARNVTQEAISSGVPLRPIGILRRGRGLELQLRTGRNISRRNDIDRHTVADDLQREGFRELTRAVFGGGVAGLAGIAR